MTQSSLIDDFRTVRFLARGSDALLQELAGISHERSLAARSVVFRYGDTAQSIFLLRDGEVNLEMCAAGVGCLPILTLGSGELLGWAPVLEHGTYTTTARTKTDARLVELNGTHLLELFAKRPELGYEFMRLLALAMAKRINTTRMQLLNVYDAERSQWPEQGSAPDAEGAASA